MIFHTANGTLSQMNLPCCLGASIFYVVQFSPSCSPYSLPGGTIIASSLASLSPWLCQRTSAMRRQRCLDPMLAVTRLIRGKSLFPTRHGSRWAICARDLSFPEVTTPDPRDSMLCPN